MSRRVVFDNRLRAIAQKRVEQAGMHAMLQKTWVEMPGCKCPGEQSRAVKGRFVEGMEKCRGLEVTGGSVLGG